MLSLIHAPAATGPTLTPAQELLAAAGLDERLAELLARDAAEHRFEPVALGLSDDPAALAEQMALLTRAEPVGGAEPLVRANQRRLGEAFGQRMRQRLLAQSRGMSSQDFLIALQAELRRLRDHAALSKGEADEEYERVQRSLRAWQTATREQPGLLRGLAGWLLGTSSQLALPQAAALWNDRERLTLARHATTAAVALLSQLAEELGLLIDNQQAAAAHARAGAAQLRERLDDQARLREGYEPWAWRGDADAIAVRLARRVDNDLLAERLAETLSSAAGLAGLEAAAQALAVATTDRLLSGMEIAQLIEAEADEEELAGSDPLVLVGQHLLTLVDQQPSWRLTRGAHPRVETVQITTDGTPLFRLDGLQTAAFGGGADRLGCMQVELEVSIDELALLHDGDGSFAAALALRNFYVLDELAASYETLPSAARTPPGSSNGTLPSDQRGLTSSPHE